MGTSQKRKKEKQKDFQKPKLKVGKAKPKPSNYTDTSFRSKAIVVNQQSLSVTAPTSTAQFSHHLALLSSKSDTQRKESLSHLTSRVAEFGSSLPQPLSMILPKIAPLLLDASSGVRTQVLKFLRSLSPLEVQENAASLLPYIRAGMTHLAADIRSSTVDVLIWLVDVAGTEIVACSGGWVKTLNCFMSLLGWHTAESAKWSANRSTMGSAGRPTVKALTALAMFLRAGLRGEDEDQEIHKEGEDSDYGICHPSIQQHMIPTTSASYAYLNLFGQPRDVEGEMYETREDRLKIFVERYRALIERGVDNVRKEGGDIGRAAAVVSRILREAEVSQ